MSDQFHIFATAVKKQFDLMAKTGELFTVAIDGDSLYDAYQGAFPAGTNEVFRVAREHECSTCKNFIRNIGNVVAIVDGTHVATVWDACEGLPAPYDWVSAQMAIVVRNASITGIYRAEMPSYGSAKTAEPATEKNGGKSLVWNHFHTGPIPSKFFAGKKVGEQVGRVAGDAQVFKRGMEEITAEAIEAVTSLLTTQGALYRGEEFRTVYTQFLELYAQYHALTDDKARNLFIWSNYQKPGARLRNTAFGTLLIDLSGLPERVDHKGNKIEAKPAKDLEDAVKTYETVMAPTNYKRPTALITPRMIQDAMQTIEALDLEASLERRFARITDVSVNDILFVDNAVRGKMKGGLADLLATSVKAAAPAVDKAVDIRIEEFLEDLKKASSLEVYVGNHQQSNFASLTAPVHADAAPLFKWDNGFAWSYDGNITDSIKERVKAAGGAVEGAMRISLAWFNYDDLDLHVIEKTAKYPRGYEIYFGNRGTRSPAGGKLDVDMNAGSGKTREAVENVVYDRLTDGEYLVVVHNYVKRETSDPGFTLEFAVDGQTTHYSCKSSPASGQANHALTIRVKNGAIVEVQMGAGIEGRAFSQEKWGIKTEQFTKVDTVMFSPNYWGDNKVGNKHVFFILEGAKNPVPTRGIYNEYLRADLEKHRKVFEVLGNKTMADPTDDQLSGVGFSSTRGDKVIVRVDGRRIYNVQF